MPGVASQRSFGNGTQEKIKASQSLRHFSLSDECLLSLEPQQVSRSQLSDSFVSKNLLNAVHGQLHVYVRHLNINFYRQIARYPLWPPLEYTNDKHLLCLCNNSVARTFTSDNITLTITDVT
jgi:hypothetical protein